MDLQHKSEHKKDKDALMEDENAAKQQTRLENLSFSKEIFLCRRFSFSSQVQMQK